VGHYFLRNPRIFNISVISWHKKKINGAQPNSYSTSRGKKARHLVCILKPVVILFPLSGDFSVTPHNCSYTGVHTWRWLMMIWTLWNWARRI